MFDQPREVAHKLKRINICNDVWYNVFALSGRADLGLKIAPICARFDGLADGLLSTIRWSLGDIEFRREKCGTRAKIFKQGDIARSPFQLQSADQEKKGVLLAESALLEVPPPPNLVGFNQIEIRYVDQSVIEFLHRISHLFANVDTSFRLANDGGADLWQLIVTHLWPIITPKVEILVNFSNRNFVCLRTLISPAILRDCANIRVIQGYGLFPEMPADDGADASVGQALAMWLHTPRTDGRPKVFAVRCRTFGIATKLEGLKMAFISANLPVSFVCFMNINHADGAVPFECVNQRTRERMTLRQISEPNQSFSFWLLMRGPIGLSKSEWADSEQKAKDLTSKSEENLISFQMVEFDNSFV